MAANWVQDGVRAYHFGVDTISLAGITPGNTLVLLLASIQNQGPITDPPGWDPHDGPIEDRFSMADCILWTKTADNTSESVDFFTQDTSNDIGLYMGEFSGVATGVSDIFPYGYTDSGVPTWQAPAHTASVDEIGLYVVFYKSTAVLPGAPPTFDTTGIGLAYTSLTSTGTLGGAGASRVAMYVLAVRFEAAGAAGAVGADPPTLAGFGDAGAWTVKLMSDVAPAPPPGTLEGGVGYAQRRLTAHALPFYLDKALVKGAPDKSLEDPLP